VACFKTHKGIFDHGILLGEEFFEDLATKSGITAHVSYPSVCLSVRSSVPLFVYNNVRIAEQI
jgi:tRNA A58 N-methylase Trm61